MTFQELAAHERKCKNCSSSTEGIDKTESTPAKPIDSKAARTDGEDYVNLARSETSATRPLSFSKNCDIKPAISTNIWVHSTISKDYTGGEKSRRADLLAHLAKRLQSDLNINLGGEGRNISTIDDKRKRASASDDLVEDKVENIPVSDKEETPRVDTELPKRLRGGIGGIECVFLGYWRDSPVPNLRNKHAVIGFIDVRGRLRTRIQQSTRLGKPISNVEYPLPPGPGGSWVTFEHVIFAEHLVGMDHHQVKEYVKLRADATEETEKGRENAEKKAAKEAIRLIEKTPPSKDFLPPAIAYGIEISTSSNMTSQPDTKRRRISSSIGTISEGPVQDSIGSNGQTLLMNV
ncbi:uncharacterized protein CTRU02_210691 [Colletotrichum truncatum]|uniref:Uncharacterized protein n=1 Tax=Colletotrichum truncatum TaxID=5467 RepID=A0ACC3YPX6_COLTU